MRVGKLLVQKDLGQNNQVQCNQCTKSSQLAEVPGHLDPSVFFEGPSVSLFLPVSANCGRGSAGIGADKISWPNGAGEVGTLGQVLTLLTTSEDAGVSSRCSCRPAGDALSAFEVESKRPACVDSCDLLHGNLEGSNHVLDYNFVFTHLNSRKPKEHQGAKDNGQDQWSAQKNSRHAIGSKDAGQGQRHGNNDGNREVSRGLSNENLHVTSVAVNEKGLCLNDL